MQWERTKYRLKMCVYIKESLNCTEKEMNKKKYLIGNKLSEKYKIGNDKLIYIPKNNNNHKNITFNFFSSHA